MSTENQLPRVRLSTEWQGETYAIEVEFDPEDPAAFVAVMRVVVLEACSFLTHGPVEDSRC